MSAATVPEHAKTRVLTSPDGLLRPENRYADDPTRPGYASLPSRRPPGVNNEFS